MHLAVRVSPRRPGSDYLRKISSRIALVVLKHYGGDGQLSLTSLYSIEQDTQEEKKSPSFETWMDARKAFLKYYRESKSNGTATTTRRSPDHVLRKPSPPEQDHKTSPLSGLKKLMARVYVANPCLGANPLPEQEIPQGKNALRQILQSLPLLDHLLFDLEIQFYQDRQAPIDQEKWTLLHAHWQHHFQTNQTKWNKTEQQLNLKLSNIISNIRNPTNNSHLTNASHFTRFFRRQCDSSRFLRRPCDSTFSGRRVTPPASFGGGLTPLSPDAV